MADHDNAPSGVDRPGSGQTLARPGIALPTTLKPIADFVFQIVVGTILFLFLFLMAVFIALVIAFFHDKNFMPPWLLQWGETAEKLIFGFDMVCYVLFLVAELAKLAVALWKDVRRTYG